MLGSKLSISARSPGIIAIASEESGAYFSVTFSRIFPSTTFVGGSGCPRTAKPITIASTESTPGFAFNLAIAAGAIVSFRTT